MKYMVGAMIKATVQLVGLQQNYLRLWSRLPLFVVFFLLCIWGVMRQAKNLCHWRGQGEGAGSSIKSRLHAYVP